MKTEAKETKGIKLKPCPFCGGNAEIINRGWDSYTEVRCTKCGATINEGNPSIETSGEYDNIEKELTTAWNNRATQRTYELKPCPLCGAEAEWSYGSEGVDGLWAFARCTECSAEIAETRSVTGNEHCQDTLDMMLDRCVTKWNSRAK